MVLAVAGFAEAQIPEHLKAAGVRVHADLDALLADPEVDLVSFCSPRKDEQGEQVIRCLEAGKNLCGNAPRACPRARRFPVGKARNRGK